MNEQLAQQASMASPELPRRVPGETCTYTIRPGNPERNPALLAWVLRGLGRLPGTAESRRSASYDRRSASL